MHPFAKPQHSMCSSLLALHSYLYVIPDGLACMNAFLTCRMCDNVIAES